MRINHTSPNFKGIKLSNNSKFFAHNLAEQIGKAGFNDIGFADFLQKHETIDKKAATANFLRQGDIIYPNEFATIFFNGDRECYVIGNSISLEQKILPVVQKFDPDAKLNLSI